MALKHTKEFLIKYGNSVEQEIETRLSNLKRESRSGRGVYSVGIATGKLYDSIRYEYKATAKEQFVKFIMDKHGEFVDKGVKPQPQYLKGKGTGKSKFIQALQKWCKVKGIPKEAAFPIRRNIWKYGIAPTHFFTIPTTRRKKQFAEGLKKALGLDYKDEILS